MAKSTSGTTEPQPIHPIYLSPDEFIDETYDEDMNMFYFDIVSYSGDLYRIGLKDRDLERMWLFRHKEHAEAKYWRHITNKH